MSDKVRNDEDVQVNGEENVEIDENILCPDESAPAQPYHAIMALDENGKTNGQLWGIGDKLMLFESESVAEKTLVAINHPDFAIRGVTKDHLEALEQLVEQGVAELFVMAGITPQGSLEAMPLKDHRALKSKAGSPPPMPPKK